MYDVWACKSVPDKGSSLPLCLNQSVPATHSFKKARQFFLYFKPFLKGLQSMYHFICAFTQNMANASKIVSRGDGFPDFLLSESQFD